MSLGMNEAILMTVGRILDIATPEQRDTFGLQLAGALQDIREVNEGIEFGFTREEIAKLSLSTDHRLVDVRNKIPCMKARRERTNEGLAEIRDDLEKLFKARGWKW